MQITNIPVSQLFKNCFWLDFIRRFCLCLISDKNYGESPKKSVIVFRKPTSRFKPPPVKTGFFHLVFASFNRLICKLHIYKGLLHTFRGIFLTMVWSTPKMGSLNFEIRSFKVFFMAVNLAGKNLVKSGLNRWPSFFQKIPIYSEHWLKNPNGSEAILVDHLNGQCSLSRSTSPSLLATRS